MVQMEPQIGMKRASMKTNHLLYRAEIGKISKCTFANPPKDKVFGYSRPHDPEDARQVMQHWEDFQPDFAQETGPDYRSMNKHAAICGLTRADQQLPFRFAHPQILARGIATHKPPPPLPSDANPWHTYGSPSTHRSQEQIRIAGREDPNIKQLVQGSFQWDWVHAYANHTRAPAGTCAAAVTNRPPARSAAAADGNGAAAARVTAGRNGGSVTLETFKLSRFKRIEPRTNTFRKLPGQAAAQAHSMD